MELREREPGLKNPLIARNTLVAKPLASMKSHDLGMRLQICLNGEYVVELVLRPEPSGERTTSFCFRSYRYNTNEVEQDVKPFRLLAGGPVPVDKERTRLTTCVVLAYGLHFQQPNLCSWQQWPTSLCHISIRG